MKIVLIKAFNFWKFYTLSPSEYRECMDKSFVRTNLIGLRQANAVVTALTLCFSVFPIMVENDLKKASVYFIISAVALLLALVSRHKYNKKEQASRLFISILIGLYYANIMFFGIYIGVLNNPVGVAASFMAFLVVALFLFTASPLFKLSLIISATFSFIVTTVSVKIPVYWTFDIVNVLIAAIITLIFDWQINKFRISSELNANRLEEERDIYQGQSMVDELTQLKNRRDFMQTFQRYLTNYRSSDDLLCIAIFDIDFFKNYNDFYGHPRGDECLTAVGKAINDIRENLNVYAARIGGEEFALLWFEKDQVQAGVENVILRLFKTIRGLEIPHEKSNIAEYITVSAGIYIMQCGESNDIRAVYEFADMALYEAKKSGRNCAIVKSKTIDSYKIKPID